MDGLPGGIDATAIAAGIAAGRDWAPLPDMTLAEAYRVQAAVTRARLGPAGPAALGGVKLAFNSAAAMAHNGLAEPCCAPLYRADLREGGAAVPFAAFRTPAVEPEIALELGRDLTGTRPDRAGAAAAVAAIRPALEVMDPRGAFAHAPHVTQTVAQGIWTAGAVLGPRIAPDRLAERHGIETALWIGGAEIGRATDAAPQDPLDALVFAARWCADHGWPLPAGAIILCGTHLPVQLVPAPGTVRATMGSFGEVAFSLV